MYRFTVLGLATVVYKQKLINVNAGLCMFTFPGEIIVVVVDLIGCGWLLQWLAVRVGGEGEMASQWPSGCTQLL